MRNQFVYTLVFPEENATTAKIEVNNTVKASFNVDKVVRSAGTPNGGLIVVLDDLRDDWIIEPVSVNPATNKVVRNQKTTKTKIPFLNTLTSIL